MLESSTGEYLDRWASFKGVVGRGFVRLPIWRGVLEFCIRKRRFTSTGFLVPWMYREENDAEMRAKIMKKLTNL